MNRRIIQGFSCFLLIVFITFCFSACKEEQLPPRNTSDTDTSTVFGSPLDTNTNDINSEVDQSSESDSETETVTNSKEDVDVSEEDKVTDTSSQTETGTDKIANSEEDTPTLDQNTTSETATNTDKVTDSSSTTSSSVSTSTVTSSTASEPSDTVNPDTEPEDRPSKPVNTNITPVSPENYYGIRWLSAQPNGENLVKTYRELVSGLKEQRETIPLSAGISIKELATVWNCCLADYPQYFWVGLRYQYYHINNKVTKIAPEYTITGKDLSKAQAQFDRSVQELLKNITSSMSQYEIEKTLHDRLILQCKYEESSNAHTSYGALVDGVAVCEGISKAFQHLCRSVGIETLFVVGRSDNPDSGNSEGHAWNIVKIDENYYHVDVTWDNAGEPKKDQIHYAWFNLSDQWLTEDHVLLQEGYSYPTCTETKENYFVKTKGTISELTVKNITEKAQKRGNTFFFQGYLTSKTDPYEWIENNASSLAKEFGLNGYQYEVITVGNEITIIMKKYS